jgi:hypothetical protein
MAYIRPTPPYQTRLHGMGTTPYIGKGVWVKKLRKGLRGLGDENFYAQPMNVIWDPASLNYKPNTFYNDPAYARTNGPFNVIPGKSRVPFLGAYSPFGRSTRRALYGMGDDLSPAPAEDLSTTLDTSTLTTPTASQVYVDPSMINPNSAQGILVQMQQQATVDQNPTDYVSPQAAIAAGLDPTSVNAAWSTALSRYPTAQAAIAAGIAPAVVTQYYTGPGGTPAASLSLPGISSNTLLYGAVGIAAIALLSGGKRGRRR